MTPNTIGFWRGELPPDERIRRALGIVRREGYRLVGDPWGNRIKVELARVLDHLAHRADDRNRWRYIPAIIPAIKRAQEIYQKDGRGASYLTYVSLLPVRHRDGTVAPLPLVTHAVESSGDRRFSTLFIQPEHRKLAKTRRRAGRLVASRPVANPVYIGTRDPDGVSRAAQRLPGAAPALTAKCTTDVIAESRQALAGLLIVGALVALGRLPRSNSIAQEAA